jgi:hypothetical protein
MLVCTDCHVNWSEGQFSPDCPQCGGGALSRLCPACGGFCAAVWRRAVHDSGDEHLGHWVGECRLTLSDRNVLQVSAIAAQWWLDESALPEYFWACLISGENGAAVIDRDGAKHWFSDATAARAWLREDEYDCLTTLAADNKWAPAPSPPIELVTAARTVLNASKGAIQP